MYQVQTRHCTTSLQLPPILQPTPPSLTVQKLIIVNAVTVSYVKDGTRAAMIVSFARYYTSWSPWLVTVRGSWWRCYSFTLITSYTLKRIISQIKTRRMAIANGTCVSLWRFWGFHLGGTGVATLSSGKHTTNTVALNYRVCNRLYQIIHIILVSETLSWTFWGPQISLGGRGPLGPPLEPPLASVSAISLRHILASPGYAPGTIAVSVTWLKSGFNACQTHHSMYPSIFNRFPVIQPVSSIVRHFNTFFEHFGLPWVRHWENRGKCYMDGKRIQCWSNAS